MVVEHSFITTMESPEALSAASTFLEQRGFVAEAQNAFQLDGGWRTLEMRRGAKKASRKTALIDWPQMVRIEWDRGKVEVAASVDMPAAVQTGRLSLMGSAMAKPNSVQTAAMRDYLFAISTSLEHLIARRNPEAAHAAWAQVSESLDKLTADRKRRSRRRLILLAVIFGLLISFIVFAVVKSHN